jgi:hypothetical protein
MWRIEVLMILLLVALSSWSQALPDSGLKKVILIRKTDHDLLGIWEERIKLGSQEYVRISYEFKSNDSVVFTGCDFETGIQIRYAGIVRECDNGQMKIVYSKFIVGGKDMQQEFPPSSEENLRFEFVDINSLRISEEFFNEFSGELIITLVAVLKRKK